MANLVDLVWSAMEERELYSPEDLADSLGQPTAAIVRALEFLTRYGFVERVTKQELIFRKLGDVPDPCGSLRILQLLIEDGSIREPRRITISKRYTLSCDSC